jgi:hypothetical protein
MYAPIVLRFNSYQVALPDALTKYCDSMLNHQDIKDWRSNADPNDASKPIDRL